MSNGVNGLFVFVEQGTDPREGVGFDAPINSLCTFDGALLQKTGDAATAWTEIGGGSFEGGTVPNATTFEDGVTLQAGDGENLIEGGVRLAAGGTLLNEGSTNLQGNLTVGAEAIMSVLGTAGFAGDFGLFGAGPVSQPASIDNAAGGATVDAEARTALNALLAACRDLGVIASE